MRRDVRILLLGEGGEDVADPVPGGRGVPRGGPSPRGGDHDPRGRHPGEGAHPHRGLLRSRADGRGAAGGDPQGKRGVCGV
ncbi:RHOT2 isoform 23 [Pan troglodytes]|uniref:RHOT2 isoform 23 n=1 Tax=Pan troglodytes TaxID=9598 RepID=A0A2J8J8E8_PANTR|nr:RHOT2 isoform 23 [Pan troglodytes]